MNEQRCSGVWVPVATPFGPDGKVDATLFLAHGEELLRQGVDGLAILGTTSEANSLSVPERLDLIGGLIDAGIDPRRLMPGTGSCSIVDAVRMTAAAVDAGCAGVLALPPFYYKGGVDDDGLFAYFAELIEAVGTDDLRLYLYHIPPIAHIGFSLPLIERLLAAYPKVIAGLKDSSGDHGYTLSVLDAFPSLAVFPGSEAFLLPSLRAGGAGCITATGNINAAAIVELHARWQSAAAVDMQEAVTRRRRIVERYPLIPGIKAVLAYRYADANWARLRSPLVALDSARAEALVDDLLDDGYDVASAGTLFAA